VTSSAWSPEASDGGPSASVYAVDETSQVGEVRRAAASLATAAALSETERGTLALVVTEAATNLARHARGGRVLLRLLDHPLGGPDAGGVEVLTVDEGPGIANLDRAFEDGFSTAGTAGQGLGAMRRLASEFDVYSRAGDGTGAGTALVARVWGAAAGRAYGIGQPGGTAATAHRPPALDVGVVCVPVRGETVCGDAWAVLRQPERTVVVVADGLGHGPEAAQASSEAVRVVGEHADAAPADLVQRTHLALRGTRGAAMAVVAIHHASGTLTFAGVGNISAAVHSRNGTRSLMSHNGTVGHVMRTVQELRYDWPADACLIAHSDGINTRWRLDQYPGLLQHHPALVSAVIWRDAARGRDDATVVVVRTRDG
jgi:anti-sigma regulatory factor (Ser/Thr protein kinase)